MELDLYKIIGELYVQSLGLQGAFNKSQEEIAKLRALIPTPEPKEEE